jgi:hypothetical protein
MGRKRSKNEQAVPNRRKPPGSGGKAPKLYKDWGPRFLAAYAKFPHIGDACKAAGIGWTRYDKEQKQNPEFKAKLAQLYDGAVTKLEDEAFRRALDPNRKSDRLLIFMLVSHKPHRYSKESRTRRLEIAHAGHVSHSVTAKVDRQRLAQLAQDPDAAEALRVLAEREAELMLQDQDRAEQVKALENKANDKG